MEGKCVTTEALVCNKNLKFENENCKATFYLNFIMMFEFRFVGANR